MVLKWMLFLVLFIHGLVHLLGFVYEWKLATIKQFSGKTLFKVPERLLKPLGVIWLLITVVFMISGLMFTLRYNYWWVWALIAVMLSQLMIILYWKDAKAGTILNVIILLAGLVGYGNWKLDHLVIEEVSEIFARNPAKPGLIIQKEMFTNLPHCVQQWLTISNITGKEMIRSVRLKQTGQMNTKKEGRWMPFTAEQYFTVQRPAFVWKASVDIGGGIFMTARDKYDKGLGNMKIQALSLYTIAKSTGKEIDQGTLLRYMAEMCWFPSAALSPYISWSAIDSLSARAFMTYRDVTASGVFRFSPGGDLESFEALRYGEFDGERRQERWQIRCKSSKEFQGIRIPAVSEVTWKLKSGDWTWLKLEITEIEYNKMQLFED